MTQTRTCQWCGQGFPTLTAKGIHLHTDHADTIGRGPTLSADWHCHRCASANQPTATVCTTCGWTR